MFGWNPVDWEQEEKLKRMFREIDTSQSGWLSESELRALFTSLDINLSPEQFQACFSDLDQHDTGEIDYKEFRHWWFMKKYGRPAMEKCPGKFLDTLAQKMLCQAFDLNEEIVGHGFYGLKLGIILAGEVHIWYDKNRLEVFDAVHADDREPVFGSMACLGDDAHLKIKNLTKCWSIMASQYVDLAWFTRQDLLWCFSEAWPDGQHEMVDFALAHYSSQLKGFQDAHVGADREVDAHDYFLTDVERLGRKVEENQTIVLQKLGDVRSELTDQIAGLESKLDRVLEMLGHNS